jgi:hypothetical protein
MALPILVRRSATGVPVGLAYDKCRFEISQPPVRWVHRRSWWLADPVTASRPRRLDQPAWRVEAVAGCGRRLTCDLTYDPAAGQWQLVGD